MYDHFPDPTLGYTDNRGSDVLNVLQKFLDNDRAPLCGSYVYVLVNRYPDGADVSRMINQLRANHVFVYIIAKTTPSAGNNPKALFDIASATNGYCIFVDGDFRGTGNLGSYSLYWPYQYISKNYVVSGSGTIKIAEFLAPYQGSVFVVITPQDHALEKNVFMNCTISSVDGANFFHESFPGVGSFGTGFMFHFPLNRISDYAWTINYSYPDNKPQRIEARMYTGVYHDFLPLPPI